MIFQCKIRPCAVPIVDISTHDTKGNLLPKPVTRTKVVKFGKSVGWVDLCSRKHFIAVDEEAKALNGKDYKEMVAALTDLGVKDIPKDAAFDYLADSLANIKASMFSKAASIAKPLLAPSEDVDGDVSEIDALREWLTENDVSFQPNTGIKKLAKYKADKEAELAEEDSDEETE